MNDLLREWVPDDEAVEFLLQLWTASQEWDDLVDEGRCSDPTALIAWWAFGKEADPFFRRYSDLLRPVLHSVYLDWTAANELERGRGDDVAKAYVLRAGFYRVVHVVVSLIRGDAEAQRLGPAIWRSYGETLAGFLLEMRSDG